ncbi:MAG TPA: adenosine deaminase [Actinomycetota bacterium]|nr:adenosine deaminase [Actinomycetota bacterium]
MASPLVSLPKVELHVHLEGTVTAETATELARRHGEEPGEVLPLVDGGYPQPFEDFAAFVSLYRAVSRQLRSPDDLATVAAAFARQQADQNVVYTEVTFTALTHVRNGMEPRAMWAALRDGFADAPPGVTIRLIVDAIRDLEPGFGKETVELVSSADAPIAGLGLSGVEGSVPEGRFALLRSAADEMGLGLSVHAGETGTPDNIRAALDDLGADRIGHGVAAVGDAVLMERLRAERTPVEVCPSSNVSLQIFPTLESHPWPQLYSAGLNVTINSDDPPFFGTTLTDELRYAQRVGGLSLADIAELQRRAALAAFAPMQERDRVLGLLDAWAP